MSQRATLQGLIPCHCALQDGVGMAVSADVLRSYLGELESAVSPNYISADYRLKPHLVKVALPSIHLNQKRAATALDTHIQGKCRSRFGAAMTAGRLDHVREGGAEDPGPQRGAAVRGRLHRRAVRAAAVAAPHSCQRGAAPAGASHPPAPPSLGTPVPPRPLGIPQIHLAAESLMWPNPPPHGCPRCLSPVTALLDSLHATVTTFQPQKDVQKDEHIGLEIHTSEHIEYGTESPTRCCRAIDYICLRQSQIHGAAPTG